LLRCPSAEKEEERAIEGEEKKEEKKEEREAADGHDGRVAERRGLCHRRRRSCCRCCQTSTGQKGRVGSRRTLLRSGKNIFLE